MDWIVANRLVDDLYRFIDNPNAVNKMTSGVCGWSWELEFREKCQEKNIDCTDAASHGDPYDCYANGLKVQCKMTGSTSKGFIDIRSKEKHRRRYSIYSFDVLAIRVREESEDRFFFVPSAKLEDPKNAGFCLGRIALDRLKEYENNWHLFAPWLIPSQSCSRRRSGYMKNSDEIIAA